MEKLRLILNDKVIIDQIKISGNKKTKENIITRELSLKKGLKLSKKDLIDKLDNIHIQNKRNIEDYGKGAVVREIDTDKFCFVTKDDKRFWMNSKWLGRPEEVWID